MQLGLSSSVQLSPTGSKSEKLVALLLLSTVLASAWPASPLVAFRLPTSAAQASEASVSTGRLTRLPAASSARSKPLSRQPVVTGGQAGERVMLVARKRPAGRPPPAPVPLLLYSVVQLPFFRLSEVGVADRAMDTPRGARPGEVGSATGPPAIPKPKKDSDPDARLPLNVP